MGGAERVVDEEVLPGDELVGERLGAALLARVETEILPQLHPARFGPGFDEQLPTAGPAPAEWRNADRADPWAGPGGLSLSLWPLLVEAAR